MSPRGTFDECLTPPKRQMLPLSVAPFQKMPALVAGENVSPTHPTRKPKMPRKRSISFHPKVTARIVESLHDMPEEEIEATWYTDYEYMAIKEFVKLSVRRLRSTKGVSPDTERVSYRGLEGRTKEGVRERSKQRNNVWAAVFLEQETQRMEGRCDPAAIGSAASSASTKSRRVARNMGLVDEREARAVRF